MSLDDASLKESADRFGRLTVTSRSSSKGNRFWVCLCDCGAQLDVSKYSLMSGVTKSCKCLKKRNGEARVSQITPGTRFGRLVVEGRAPSIGGRAAWRCKCDCGLTVDRPGVRLRKGLRSCGCLTAETTKATNAARRKVIPAGMRFGRLVVEGEHGRKNGCVTYMCKCDCGASSEVTSGSLLSGSTRSCKCLKRESMAKVGASCKVVLPPGTRFGRLTVIAENGRLGHEVAYLCQCDCGKQKLIRSASLSSGSTRSCSCLADEWSVQFGLANKSEISPGARFGQLVAVAEKGRDHRDNVIYECLCDCGESSDVIANSLLSGNTRSCGCAKSHIENELAAFVKSLDPTAIRNDRLVIAPKEIDVLVPGTLAIELHGLHWHGEEMKGPAARTDSFDKIGLLDQSGIPRRFIFFEDEWLEHRSAVEGYIRAALSAKKTIGARKTTLVDEGSDFIAQNHIQGAPASCQVVLALSYGGAIVAAAAFRKRGAKMGPEGTWELTRYCVGGVSVAGGLGKLMAEFWRRVPATSLVTFSDRRLSQGAIYLASGFQKVGEVVPRYWYTRGSQRFHRFKFRKDSLKARGWLNDGETEAACMLRMGYDRIWDAGKVKWELARP